MAIAGSLLGSTFVHLMFNQKHTIEYLFDECLMDKNPLVLPSFDIPKGQPRKSQCVKVQFMRLATTLTIVEFDDNSVITCTPELEYGQLNAAGLVVPVMASGLKVGSRCVTCTGLEVRVQAVATFKSVEPKPVFNLIVDDTCTYFVGSGVLVSNLANPKQT